MTAEIIVANRLAVALAADSAATLEGPSGTKIFNSANKIFQLLHRKPVGAMIYGSSTLNGVPWELIVKQFREDTGPKEFRKMKDIQTSFLAFIEGFVEKNIRVEVETLKYRSQYVLREVVSGLPNNMPDDAAEYERVMLETIEDFREAHEIGVRVRIPALRLPRGFGAIIQSKVRDFVHDTLADTPKIKSSLNTTIKNFVKAGRFTDAYSRVVIAGFAEESKFPEFRSIEIEDSLGGKYPVRETGSIAISTSNRSCIRAFAQSDVVQNFMNGVHSDMYMHICRNMAHVIEAIPVLLLAELRGVEPGKLSRKDRELAARFSDSNIDVAMDAFSREIDKISRDLFSNPVISMVNHFDKDHLAALAESLVNITALRRRVSADQETVGGPIDVAVISRHDGFIWIKRKHYFDANINLDFVARRHYRGTGPNRSETRRRP